jgi:membrane protein YqaA with SNARE-associated domain/cbb3-type cytochrome oxidase subunit 3
MEAMRAALDALHAVMADLLHWVEALAQRPDAGWALFSIAFVESSFFPIPPDILLIPLCLGEPRLAFWFAAVCSLGSVLGGIAGYGIGYYGGRPLLYRLFDERKIAAVESYYDRYNAWATGIAGLTPLPYKLFTISGGAFAIRFRVFLLASIVSRSLRFFVIAALLYVFGDVARAFIDRHLGWLTIVFVVLLVGGFWFVGRRARRAARSASERAPEGRDSTVEERIGQR